MCSALAQSAVLATLTFALLLLGMAPLLNEAHHVAETSASSVARGVNVLRVTADERLSIDSRRCDALQSVEGVRAAGAIVRTEPLRASSDKTYNNRIYYVTPGFMAVAWHQAPEDGRIALGAVTAERLGIIEGADLRFASHSGTQRAGNVNVPAGPARLDAFETSLVVPIAAEAMVDECLVESVPGSRAAVEKVVMSWFGEGFVVVPFDPHLQPIEETVARFRQSTALWTGPFSVALVLTAQLVWVWVRRVDLVQMKALGLNRAGLGLLVTTEIAIVTLPAALILFGCAVSWATSTGYEFVVDAIGIEAARMAACYASGLLFVLLRAVSFKVDATVKGA